MTWVDFLIRSAASVLFGLSIGVERQLTGHAAGIRINVLVSFGACAFSLFPWVVGSSDLTRISAQIVTGVGFLCSGIIFKDGFTVRGLNTAATIWCTAGIGMLASTGKLHIAAIATGLLLTANVLLRPLANMVQPISRFDESEHTYLLSITCSEAQEFSVRTVLLAALRDHKLSVSQLESEDISDNRVEIEARILCRGKRRDDVAETIVGRIGAEPEIYAAGWSYEN